jgi:serine/threonine protein kinase
MECLDDDGILALLEDGLTPRRQEHIDRCDDCRALVAMALTTGRDKTAGASAALIAGETTASAQASSSTLPLAPGDTFGCYEVIEPIGQGGMGVVYAAYDRDLDRRFALKLIRRDITKGAEAETLRARFMREAQAMARLAHANVVHVYDVGVWNDQLFIAMEWIDGMTLSQWLRERRRDWREVLRMFLAAGRGLAAAHAAGLVHRDFKPDNVMIGRDGSAHVTDFGLARSAGESGSSSAASSPDSPLFRDLTSTGLIIGTPGYMAPEQLRGEATDMRSDVFSFCVALYEALAGVRPFVGRSRKELLDAIDGGKLEPGHIDGVPRELRRALAQGLRAAPDERPASMNTLLSDLSRDLP